MTEHFDVIVVGSGLAGQSAALVMARANIRVCLVDSRDGLNIAGHNFITRDGMKKHELIELGNADLRRYSNVTLHEARVASTSQSDEVFHVEYEDGRSFTSDFLILANGIQYRSQIFELPGAREIFGTSMFTCPYCHGYEYTGKRFAVINRDDSSPEDFAVLSSWTKQVSCFSNGSPVNENDGFEEFLQRLSPENRIVRAPIAGFVHDNGSVRSIELTDGSSVEVDAILLTELDAMPNKFAEQLGTKKVEEEQTGNVIYPVDRIGRTTVRNLLMVGDSKNGFSTLIGAANEGFVAGHFLVNVISSQRFEAEYFGEMIEA